MHSVSPFGNPHFIDPVCLTRADYSAVIVVVKVESLFDITHLIHFKNYDGSGSMGRVHIIHFEGDDTDSDSNSDSNGSDAPLSPVLLLPPRPTGPFPRLPPSFPPTPYPVVDLSWAAPLSPPLVLAY